MKKIGLVGYFGWGNFGDELFLEAHRQHLGNKYELVVANDLTRAPYFSRPVSELANEVDAFIIGGGDLLNPLRVSDLYWRKEFLEKPVFIFGLGVPNMPFRREAVINRYREFINHPNCKLIVARDVESYTWIRDFINPGEKLCWYPDPVCSLARPVGEDSTRPALSRDSKVLGVVMREHRSLSLNFEHLRRMIDTARKMDYEIRHLVLATKELGEADARRAVSLADEGEEVVRSEDLMQLCREISYCDALATIKFHGAVVATMYGIPAITMSSTPKNRNFMTMIERRDLLSSYTDPNLYKHLSHYPARINNKVRSWLYRQSNAGYSKLMDAIEEEI